MWQSILGSNLMLNLAGVYHRIKVGEAVDQSGSLGELLAKGIAKVVSGIRGDNENLLGWPGVSHF